MDSLQKPHVLYFPKRLSQALGVTVANLAQLTGVHRNPLRNPLSERLGGRMREMVKVISTATELTGNARKAIYWYRNELVSDYGHRTAAEPKGVHELRWCPEMPRRLPVAMALVHIRSNTLTQCHR